MSVTRKWSLLAALLAVAIMAAGWFLLVSPKRSHAAELRDQTATAEAQNASLVQQLEILKAQQAELPAQRAKLALMRKQIPDNPSLPTMIRTLTKAGKKVGVSVDSLAPAAPALMTPAVPVVAPAAPAATTDGTADATDTAATASAPAAAPAPAPLYQVPVNLVVTGSYAELSQFVGKLEDLRRSFLVSGFALSPADGGSTTVEATTDGSGPAPGDLTLSLQGRVFMSPPVAAPAVAPTPTTTTAPAQ